MEPLVSISLFLRQIIGQETEDRMDALRQIIDSSYDLAQRTKILKRAL